MFQLLTITKNCSMGGRNTVTWRLGSSPNLCIVCSRKSSGVAVCPWSRSGKRICFRGILTSEQLKNRKCWREPECCQPSKKYSATCSEMISADSRRILSAASSLQFSSWAKAQLILPCGCHCRWQIFCHSSRWPAVRWAIGNWPGLGVRKWGWEGWISFFRKWAATSGGEHQQITCSNQQRACILQPAWFSLWVQIVQS